MISGVTIHQTIEGAILCIITDFSNELRGMMRDKLRGIFHGDFSISDNEDIGWMPHDYAQTLKEFLRRYRDKTEETKMGFMGEFLAHVLIGEILHDLKSASIYKNIEERSIKKGFDIVYYDAVRDRLWYSEVKSGKKNSAASVTSANKSKIKEAKADIIKSKFGDSDRLNNLWELARIGAEQALGQTTATGKKVKELLMGDLSALNNKTSSINAILVSAMYESPDEECIDYASFQGILQDLTEERIFENVMIFSIQKETYEKIAAFLEAEANADA